jgi:predicted RNA-binding Zn-ribbon protein involved in translation (DUF1610 family)
LTAYIVEHQCPRCGGPAELEESDRLFRCTFCKAGSYLSVPDFFRYVLPHKAPAGKELIYFPYWRFKGMLFFCVPGQIKNNFVDVSQQAVASPYFPFSLGFRSQTQKLRVADGNCPGIYLKPRAAKAELLERLNENFSTKLPKPLLLSAQIGEAYSMLYAPFYLESRLMDAMLNEPTVSGTAEQIEPLLNQTLAPDWPITFIPTLCPLCGWDLEGERDTLGLTCPNCTAVWMAKGQQLERLPVEHQPALRTDMVFLPFWRIEADIEGLTLKSYADLVRVANLPRVVQPGWEGLPFYFWTPAFKAQPQRFLSIAAHVTTSQPRIESVAGLPQGAVQGINMPLQEALESIGLILAFSVKPRPRMEAIITNLRVTLRRSFLVYLPFEEGPHEVIHPGMNLAISKNLLSHAKNL